MNKNDLYLQVEEIENRIQTSSPKNIGDLKSFVEELVKESRLEFDYACLQITKKNYELAFGAFIKSLENIRWIPIVLRNYKAKAGKENIKVVEKLEKDFDWVNSRREDLKQICQFLSFSWN